MGTQVEAETLRTPTGQTQSVQPRQVLSTLHQSQGQGSIWENLWPSPGRLPCRYCSVTKLCMGMN